MAEFEIPFGNQEGRSSVAQNSRETLINMFAEIETSGRRKLVRRQRMCLDPVHALIGEKRAIEKANGLHYLIVKDKFYTFDGAALTECGTLDTESGPCTMIFDDNGDVLMSDGVTAYHWTGVVFSKPETISEVGTLTFLGGFAVYNEPGMGRFWWSGVNDMQAWDGLDFATAEGKPDVLVRVFEDHRELWLFGEETVEIWALSGGTDSPFTPQASMERGCGAALSVVGEDNSVFWLGDDWIVYRADGYRPVRVSTHSVERRIDELPEEARRACVAFTYTDQGHKFLTFRFPGFLTLQYNIATGFWNEARTFNRPDWEVLGPSFTKTDFVLTRAGISRPRRGLNTDDGVVVERGGVSAPIAQGAQRIVLRTFFLDCEVGRAAIGVTPKVMLRTARDGETFGNERVRDLAAEGNYARRAIWRNCGMGRRITVAVMLTDDVEFTILGADVDAEAL